MSNVDHKWIKNVTLSFDLAEEEYDRNEKKLIEWINWRVQNDRKKDK